MKKQKMMMMMRPQKNMNFKHEYSEEKIDKKEKESKDIYNASSLLNTNYRSNRKVDQDASLFKSYSIIILSISTK